MTGQVAALRGVGMAVVRLGPEIPILFMAGGVLGLLTAVDFGFDVLSPWLLIAYVLFTGAMLIGVFEDRPRGIRMGSLLAQTPDGPLTPELRAMFTGPRVVAFAIANYVVIGAIIFDMVVKPFS